MLLYRPVGLIELRLIFESGMMAFPPRLPEQPIFYPVLNIEYARQIAFEWNTTSEPFAGYVTQFEVEDKFLNQFERKIVGGKQHEELWIPAELLMDFNEHIHGRITVIDASFGKEFNGFIGENTNLRGKNAIDQFLYFEKVVKYSPFDAHAEIIVNKTAVFLNYPFWQVNRFEGLDQTMYHDALDFIHLDWKRSFPEIQLGI